MLKDHLKKRFTAKWWDDKEVEQEKLQNVLEAAYLSPSKQGTYRYKVIVITNSENGKSFKKWLYEENSWCYEGVRGKQGQGKKRYNGQVLAPVVLAYLIYHQDQSDLEDLPLKNHIDTIVNATVAMCAAEEQGLSTGFNSTVDGLSISRKLGYPDTICTVLLGIGYATSDLRIRRGIYDKNGDRVGYDYSNTDPNLKLDINRTQKSKIEDFFKFL